MFVQAVGFGASAPLKRDSKTAHLYSMLSSFQKDSYIPPFRWYISNLQLFAGKNATPELVASAYRDGVLIPEAEFLQLIS